jgi:hypothetical protein
MKITSTAQQQSYTPGLRAKRRGERHQSVSVKRVIIIHARAEERSLLMPFPSSSMVPKLVTITQYARRNLQPDACI